MNDREEDEFWSEVGAALTPRRSEARWRSLRARIVARVRDSAAGPVRPWVAAGALASLGFGLLLINRLAVEPPEVRTAVVPWDTRISAVEGLVTVVPSGQDAAVPAEDGLPVEAGDVIQVGAGGRAELAFSDKGVVSIGPDSELKLAQLNQDQSYLDMKVGSLVAKLDWHGDGVEHRLAVRTPSAVAAVRGTEFGVVVDAAGGTSVGVFDQGRVAVTASGSPSVAQTMLIPNQEVRVGAGAAPDTETRGGRDYLRAGALADLQPYRGVLADVRGHETALRRDWRPLSREDRAQERSRRFGSGPGAPAGGMAPSGPAGGERGPGAPGRGDAGSRRPDGAQPRRPDGADMRGRERDGGRRFDGPRGPRAGEDRRDGRPSAPGAQGRPGGRPGETRGPRGGSTPRRPRGNGSRGGGSSGPGGGPPRR